MKTRVVPASELDPKKGLRAESYVEGKCEHLVAYGGRSRFAAAMKRARALAEGLNVAFFYPPKLEQSRLTGAGLPMPARAPLGGRTTTLMSQYQGTLNFWVVRVHKWSKGKGWWKRPQGDVAKKLLMLHTEISEMTEDLRDADSTKDLNIIRWEYDKHGQLKPIGFASELADLFIRLADLAGKLDIDLNAVVALKMRFNDDRPYQHGGKKL